MLDVTDELLQRTISLLGEGERRDAEIVVGVARFAPDKMTARRLIDWIPEAFALVLIPHVGEVTLPTTFSAKAADGGWKEFPLEREPIVAQAMKIGTAMYEGGQRDVFSAVVKRSALLGSVNKTLNEGASITGATLGGPAMIGVPAELYEPKAGKTSFWRRLVG
jgi:hypothetical protein